MASFGETLRRERELRGISLRDMADATKISLRFLQALEEDRVAVLPGGLFPRAFVRQYAAFLGLDAERTVAEFLFAHGENVGIPARAPTVSFEEPSRLRPLLLVPAAAALAALGFVMVRQLRQPEPPPAPPPSLATPAPAVSLPTDRVYPAPGPSAPPVAAAPDAALVLAIQARKSCWVMVQADGVRVMARELAEGERQTLRASREIVLSVGNAGGIAIELNGRPGLALGREGQVRNNIVITPQSLPSLVQARPAAGAPPS
jgi:cytoskeleton protein RodZ